MARQAGAVASRSTGGRHPRVRERVVDAGDHRGAGGERAAPRGARGDGECRSLEALVLEGDVAASVRADARDRARHQRAGERSDGLSACRPEPPRFGLRHCNRLGRPLRRRSRDRQLHVDERVRADRRRRRRDAGEHLEGERLGLPGPDRGVPDPHPNAEAPARQPRRAAHPSGCGDLRRRRALLSEAAGREVRSDAGGDLRSGATRRRAPHPPDERLRSRRGPSRRSLADRARRDDELRRGNRARDDRAHGHGRLGCAESSPPRRPEADPLPFGRRAQAPLRRRESGTRRSRSREAGGEVEDPDQHLRARKESRDANRQHLRQEDGRAYERSVRRAREPRRHHFDPLCDVPFRSSMRRPFPS